MSFMTYVCGLIKNFTEFGAKKIKISFLVHFILSLLKSVFMSD